MAKSEGQGCSVCKHFKTGHLDNHINWLKCEKGHLLLDKDKLVHEYHPYRDQKQEKIRVTTDCWAEDFGNGEPMLDRDDCPDYQEAGLNLT